MATYYDISPKISRGELKGYDIETDEQAIKNSLLNIFTVSKGDVPGKPYFGNPMDVSLFDLFDFFNQANLESAIQNAIEKYEPRVNLHRVIITGAPEYNRIIIQLEYSFVVKDVINYDTLTIPYTHNSISYIGGRQEIPSPEAIIGACPSNS